MSTSPTIRTQSFYLTYLSKLNFLYQKLIPYIYYRVPSSMIPGYRTCFAAVLSWFLGTEHVLRWYCISFLGTQHVLRWYCPGFLGTQHVLLRYCPGSWVPNKFCPGTVLVPICTNLSSSKALHLGKTLFIIIYSTNIQIKVHK